MPLADKPWGNWPLTIHKKQADGRIVDQSTFPEYQFLTNRKFLAEMAKEVRDGAVKAIKKAYVEKYGETTENVAIVLMGGSSIDWVLYDTDVDKTEFRQESYFAHLFGVNEPDLYGIIDLTPEAGEAILVVPHISDDAARWNGSAKPTEEYETDYLLDKALTSIDGAEELTTIVQEQLKQRNIKKVLILKGVNSDSGLTTTTIPTFIYDAAKENGFVVDDSTFLHDQLSLFQSIKTPKEIEYLKVACKVSAMAHVYVMANIKSCHTELQCEALFKGFCSYYGASRALAYTCICGSGPNGAILHYGHAAHPNSRLVQDGEMIVLDMGGQFGFYATDLTRTYPSNGKFTAQQKAVFDIVRKAQLEIFSKIKPGVSWRDLHRLSERIVLQGLIDLGVLKDDIDGLVKNYVSTLFYPHGLGHLLGCTTHSPGGYLNCEPKSTEPGLCWLRLGRNLEAGMVVTVEPGMYFNMPWINTQLKKCPQMRDFVNFEELEKYAQFGGVRLEDDVVVTETGYELLTGDWPSTVDEIEEVCAALNNKEIFQ